MDINLSVNTLVSYAVKNHLIEERDRLFALNGIIALLNIKSIDATNISRLPKYASSVLAEISAYAAAQKIIEDISTAKELFETKIMGVLTARPSDFTAMFLELEHTKGIKAATDWMYNINEKNDYIKVERIAKNIVWKTNTAFGKLDMSINLSKPEKDPKEIALLAKIGKDAIDSKGKYPKCLLCKENEGFEGTMTHPARQNLRLIPLNLAKEKWFLQYSPYVYYNEHSIVLYEKHEPMKISHKTFERLADFLEIFPHYFIGSNADLPIVGGSILDHDHYQGGRYTFAMEKAKPYKKFKLKKFPKLECSVVDWPLTVLRIRGSKKDVLSAANLIFDKWCKYSDESVNIVASTEGTRHNTITPIARVNKGKLEMDLVLRNNRTSEQYPSGIFHSRPEYHNIKRENIGLIEVMGMAILPGRLKAELKELGEYLVKGKAMEVAKNSALAKHACWALELAPKHKFTSANVEKILMEEVGIVFAKVLECCGVFKKTPQGSEALDKFIKSL